VRRAIPLTALCLALLACDSGPRADAPRRQTTQNPRSIGMIDIPANDATIDTPVRVSGWAVDESGVTGVRIFFDDELMVTAPIVTPRPDVEKAFPKFTSPGAIHGFEAMIDAGSHAGYTVIRAVAIDGKGAQTEVFSISVKIRE
jgi:N-acetylmuramoyl-L-alanine amidase